jgi:hypothetical protein
VVAARCIKRQNKRRHQAAAPRLCTSVHKAGMPSLTRYSSSVLAIRCSKISRTILLFSTILHPSIVPRLPLGLVNEYMAVMDVSNGRILGVHDQDSTKLLQQQITTSEWQTRSRQAKWDVNWRAPFKMLGLLVSGVGLAFGHYFYFKSLDGTIVVPPKSRYDLDDQEWHARFGTALAFLVKTCFAAAVTIAYKQSAWLNMRSNAHSISGLDSMFSGTTDILAYLSLDFMLNAKVAALMAGVTWYFLRLISCKVKSRTDWFVGLCLFRHWWLKLL